MRIYLDNCCYCRPFDSQADAGIKSETDAKMFVQQLIKFRVLDLVYSYMTLHEIEANPIEYNRFRIKQFVEINAKYYVRASEKIVALAEPIMQAGVKYADAYHTACALFAQCDVFLTTDKRLLKYKSDKITLLNPIDFVKRYGGAL
jgi:predicted nucleic acid-binding protein